SSLQKTDGWDFEAGYNFDVGNVIDGWNVSMQLDLKGTYVNEFISTGSTGIPVDTAGCVGTCTTPHLRYNISAIYLNDPWQVSLSGNWIGGGVYSNLAEGRYAFGPNAAV